jgi:hypothetical protein
MTLDEVIANVLRIPELYLVGNASPSTLVAQSGYLTHSQQVTEQQIADAIRRDPAIVEKWLQWAADKRVSEGWYFSETAGGEFVVGYFSKHKGHANVTTYSDKVLACAAFIKRECEVIASLAKP